MTDLTTYQLDDYVPSGSCLKGHINAPYTDLVEAFGEPNIGPSDKVWTEWSIRFTVQDTEMNEQDDHYVTIYDWKESHPDHSRIGEYRWHIGSRSNEAVWLVLDVLNAPGTMERIAEDSYLGKTPGTPEWEKVSQLRDSINEQEKDYA